MRRSRHRHRAARHEPLLVVGACILLGACGGSSPSGGTNTKPGTASNVVAVQVNHGPTGGTINGLYISIRICIPGTSTCQSIDNVLVDTGSEGLRVLGSVVTLTLPSSNTTGGDRIWNCTPYADGSYTWGPLATADIHLGDEVAADVPIQLITRSSSPRAPQVCSSGGIPADTLQTLNANGIIGVGTLRQDCGSYCTGSSPEPVYFACTTLGCNVAAVAVAEQLQNPIIALPVDNTGLVLTLPVVPATGAPTALGTLLLGVGTRANNSVGNTPVYTTSAEGYFTTILPNQSQSLTSFVDTGSNGLFFLDSNTIGLPPCTTPSAGALGFSCPPQPVAYTATTIGTDGTRGIVTFSVANAETLFASGNAAFDNLAGPAGGSTPLFDWGLPFFFGRSVYEAINGAKTPAGVGPFLAF